MYGCCFHLARPGRRLLSPVTGLANETQVPRRHFGFPGIPNDGPEHQTSSIGLVLQLHGRHRVHAGIGVSPICLEAPETRTDLLVEQAASQQRRRPSGRPSGRIGLAAEGHETKQGPAAVVGCTLNQIAARRSRQR